MKRTFVPSICLALLLSAPIAPGVALAQVAGSGSAWARQAVGQCYSDCMARIGQEPPLSGNPFADGGLLGGLILGPNSGGVCNDPSYDSGVGHDDDGSADDCDSDASDGWDSFIGLSGAGLCEEAQNRVRLMDGCNAGCVDVGAAYGAAASDGVMASEARKRFNQIFDEARKPLEAVGLWTGYDSSPMPGTATFDTACQALLEAED
ncbi:MAG: hypothetical protein OXJ53_05435 [Gammaproteobacteria bacterium]|nr:hypothetical protein [Gammaproteobacteria bacterium]